MGKVIAAAAYSAGRKVANISVEESGQWAAQPGHFVWIGIEGCQSAQDWDPGSACNRDPLPRP